MNYALEIKNTFHLVVCVVGNYSIGGVNVEICRAGNGVYPLIIFSHGMGGCPGNTDGIQSPCGTEKSS